MKPTQKGISPTVILVLGLFVVPLAFAQMGMDQGRGPRMHMPKYDPSTVVTVKGSVEEVQEGMMESGQTGQMGQMGQMQGMHHMGLHLVLQTDKESLILVGPSSFVKEKGFTFAKGDQIEVTGSKVKYNNSDVVIAREIKKGDKTLTLRDEKGIPGWSMGRQR
jgi:hypothetical protein